MVRFFGRIIQQGVRFSVLFAVVILVLISQATSAQTTYYSRATGSFNTAGTWSTVAVGGASCACIPSATNDIIIIGGGNVVTLTNIGGTASVGTVTIDNGTLNLANGFTVNGTTTVGGVGNGTLGITGTIGTKLFIGAVTINVGSTWNETAIEPITFQGGITNNGTFTANTANHTFNTNSQNLFGTLSIPTVTVTGGAVVLTNNNVLTVGTSLAGTGRLTQGANATLTIGGTSTISNMTATASGNTVTYSGAAQTVNNIAFHNLTLSGSAIKTLQAGTTSIGGNLTLSGTISTTAVTGLTVGGSLDVGLGTTFSGSTFSHAVGGNVINSGTFSGTGTITLNGASQALSGNAIAFSNLTLSGSGIKTFGFSTVISGILTVGTGVTANLGSITTHSANSLILGVGIQPAGTWGSTASAASNQNDTYFSNTGFITIATGNFTYYSRATGNWNSSSTWSTVGHGSATNSGTYPQPGDYAIIGGGFTVTVASAESCANVLFDAGTSVTNTLTIGSGSSLSVSTITIPQTVTSGANIFDVGSGSLTAANVSFTATSGGAGHQLTIGTGTATISGNVSGIGASSTVAFTAAGLLQVGGSLFSAANGTLTAFAGSTVEYNSALAQTVEVHSYSNLTVSGGNTKSLAGTMTLTGNLSIGNNTTLTVGANTIQVNGTTTIGGGTSGTLTINSTTGSKTFLGLVTVAAGGTWNNSANENATFQGGITNNGTFTAGTGNHTFNTNSQALTGVFTIPSVIVTGAAIALTNNGTLNIATSLAGSGRLTQGTGATLNLGGTSSITSMTANAAGNTVIYSGAAQTVNNVAFHNLTLSGSGIKTLQAGTTSISGNLTLSGTVSATAVAGLTIGGTLDVGVGTTFTGGSFSHNVGGTFLNNGTFTSGGTISLTGGSQSLSGVNTSFTNLTLAGTGTKSFGITATLSGVFTVNGGVVADLGTSVAHTSNSLILNGAIQLAGVWGSTASAALNINDTYFSNIGRIAVATGSYTYYSRATGDWNNPLTWSTVGHGSAVNGGTYPQGSDYAVIGGGFVVTVTGNETLASLSFDAGTSVTNTLNISGASSLTVAGSVIIPQTSTSGINVLDIGSGSLSAANLSFTSTTSGAGQQLTIGTGTATISGDITGVGASSTVAFTGAGLLRVGGNLFTSANGTLTTAVGSTVEYNSTGAQTVQAHTYRNLTVSGGNTKTMAATMTLTGNLNVANNTTLTVGAITLQVVGTTTIGGGGSTLNITSITGTKSFLGLVTIASGGIWNNSSNDAVTFQGGITNNGTFTAGTGVQTFNTNSQSLTGIFTIPSVTVTGAAISLTNNNTLTVGTALAGTGRITQAAGATLNIGGTSTITNMTATASGNTVNYTGAAQTIHNVAFYNLGLSGSGIKTLQVNTTSIGGSLLLSGTANASAVADMVIGGAFDLGAGSTFVGGSFTHSVAGNFTNNGTFSSSGEIILNGAGQSFIGQSTSFTALTLSGSGTKVFGFEVTASGALSIGTGVVADLGVITSHSANTLVLGGVIQSSAGTWGSSASTATNTNNTYFTNSGIVTISLGFYTYFSRSSGDWTDPNTWSTVSHGSGVNSGTYPQTGDFAIIGGGFSVTVSTTEVCGTLSFDPGTSVTNTLTINSGSDLTVEDAINIPQTITSGTNNLNVGDGTLVAPDLAFTSTVGGAGHRLTINNGTATIGNNLTGIGASSTVLFTGNGLMQIGGSFFASTNGTLTTAVGSTVEFNGSGAQSIPAHSYHNLSVSGGNVKTLAATMTLTGNLFVDDNTTLNVGAVTFTVNGTTTVGNGTSGVLNISSVTGAKTFIGLVTIESGATWNNSANESIVFRGGLNNIGTFTAGTGLYTFNTSSQALSGILSIPNVTVTGAAVVLTNTGTLTVTNALAGTGGLTQAVDASLTIGGTSAIANMTATATGNTVNYAGAAQTVRANNYYHLTLSGTGVKTLQAATTNIAGDFTITGSASATAVVGLTVGGALVIDGGCSFDGVNFVHNVGGDLVLDGNLLTNSGTIALNGTTNQNIQGATETTFNNLTISNASGVVSVESNTNLAGTLTLGATASFDADGSANAAVFTLLSTDDNPAADGNIAQLPTGATFTGNITVQRYMSAIDDADRFISSPLSNATVSQLQDDFSITGSFTGTSYPCTGCKNNGASLRRYNETATGGTFRTGYTGVPASGGNSATTTLVPGVGYNPWMWNGVTPITWDLTGTINRGPINFTVSHTASSPARPTDDGWNLVGNPYPSAIQWRANGSGWTKSANIDPVVWVWDVIGGVFQSANEAGVGSLTNGVIALGQGFWVHVTSPGAGTLSVDESAKSLAGNGTYYRTRNSEINTVRFNLIKDGVAVSAFLMGDDRATTSFDKGIDAPLLELGIERMSIGFDEQDVKLAYMGIPSNANSDIPIYIKAEEEGVYELQAEALGALGLQEGYALVDNLTGEQHELSGNLKISFQHLKKAPQNRFLITKKSDVQGVGSSFVNVFPNPTTGDVFLLVPASSKVKTITVLNNAGQIIKELSANTQTEFNQSKPVLSLADSPAGVYLIKLVLDDQVIIKRVVKH